MGESERRPTPGETKLVGLRLLRRCRRKLFRLAERVRQLLPCRRQAPADPLKEAMLEEMKVRLQAIHGVGCRYLPDEQWGCFSDREAWAVKQSNEERSSKDGND